MDSQIVVRGVAHTRVMPDRAHLQATIDGDGGTREHAYEQAAIPAKQLDDVIAGHQASLARVTTAAMLVQPRTRWHKGESVRAGWQATRRSILEVVDLTALGQLIAELTAAGAAIVGPTWNVDPVNPAYAEVRRLAAQDARSRAEAYAGALGLHVAGVAWVAEPGLRQHARLDDGNAPMAMAMAMAGRAAAPEDVIEVAVDEVCLDAHIDVAFGFTGPS